MPRADGTTRLLRSGRRGGRPWESAEAHRGRYGAAVDTACERIERGILHVTGRLSADWGAYTTQPTCGVPQVEAPERLAEDGGTVTGLLAIRMVSATAGSRRPGASAGRRLVVAAAAVAARRYAPREHFCL